MLEKPAVWVFGMLDMNTNKILMEVVSKRDADTLLPIIQTTVTKGTTIWSYQWKSYDGLTSIGYPHETVNHSVSFVAPNGVNTQRIEATWSLVKRWLAQRSIKSRSKLEEYLHEFCFRRNLAPNFGACWHLLNN